MNEPAFITYSQGSQNLFINIQFIIGAEFNNCPEPHPELARRASTIEIHSHGRYRAAQITAPKAHIHTTTDTHQLEGPDALNAFHALSKLGITPIHQPPPPTRWPSPCLVHVRDEDGRCCRECGMPWVFVEEEERTP